MRIRIGADSLPLRAKYQVGKKAGRSKIVKRRRYPSSWIFSCTLFLRKCRDRDDNAFFFSNRRSGRWRTVGEKTSQRLREIYQMSRTLESFVVRREMRGFFITAYVDMKKCDHMWQLLTSQYRHRMLRLTKNI